MPGRRNAHDLHYANFVFSYSGSLEKAEESSFSGKIQYFNLSCVLCRRCVAEHVPLCILKHRAKFNSDNITVEVSISISCHYN